MSSAPSRITKPILLGIFLLTLTGGLLVLGGLGAITNDSPVGATPYKFGWYLWSYEVFALLVLLATIFTDTFKPARLLLVGLFTIQSPLLIDRIELFLDKGAALPGGSDERGNVVAAGLILVVIGNFFLLFAAGISYWEDTVAAPKYDVNSNGNGRNGKV